MFGVSEHDNETHAGRQHALNLLKLGTALTATVATADFASAFHKPSDALRIGSDIRDIVHGIVAEYAALIDAYEAATETEIHQ